MPRYVALLRAVNVGGTGKLPMAELRRIASAAGFADVATYIASGNLVFATHLSRDAARAALESGLQGWFGQHVPVFLRDAAELESVLAALPWPEAPGNQVMVTFLDAVGALDLRHQTDEKVVPGASEIYAYYPSGMGRSKLVIKGAEGGTARNVNTVRKLAEMLANGS